MRSDPKMAIEAVRTKLQHNYQRLVRLSLQSAADVFQGVIVMKGIQGP